jgi:excinuclease ABC subunit C
MRFAKFWKEISKSMKDFNVMTDLALNMHFEEAQKIKENWNFGELPVRSTIVNENYQYRLCFRIRWCSLCQLLANFPRFHHSIPHKSKARNNETDEELLELAIIELRERFQLLSREVIVPFT